MELLLFRVLDRGRPAGAAGVAGMAGVAGVAGVTGAARLLTSGDPKSPVLDILPLLARIVLAVESGLGIISTRSVNATFEDFLSRSNGVGLGGGIARAPTAGLTGALQLCLGTWFGLGRVDSGLSSGVVGG